MRVGRFAVLGIGFWQCLQCDHLPTEIDHYGVRYVTAFPTITHLRHHLANSGCHQSQGLSRILRPPRNDLFDAFAYKVDNRPNKLHDEDDRETV